MILLKPSVVSRCFFALFVAAISFLHQPEQAGAQGADTISLPLMFDPRERLQRPDMASVPRIRFVTTVDFPPFNFIDQSGKLSGFHVDLAREICRELNVLERCQIEAVPYKDLMAVLAKGDGDVIAAGLRVTPSLRQEASLSRPFMQLPARFVTTLGQAKLTDPASLQPGEAGVVAGTAHEAMLAAFLPNLKPRTYSKREDLLAALRKGEIKAAFGDGLQMAFWVESRDAAGCCRLLGGPYYSRLILGDGLTLVTRKDAPLIAQGMDAALLALSRSGRLNQIYLRYFPNGL
ncbi:transporter substrate-binding domain-containing protein [Rhizobium sp.]